MHIEPTTHEHGATGTIYTYEGDFDVGQDAITWRASAIQAAGRVRTFTGTIPLTSPAVAALAGQAVRDEIVKNIDTFDDKAESTDVDAVVDSSRPRSS
jgi:hypothetical protein